MSNFIDTKEDLKLLAEFQMSSVARGADSVDRISPLENVTALMYFYWAEDKAVERWFEFEGALLETWRNCGLLKTIIVTNCLHVCLQEFAERFSNVRVQIEPLLVPGDLDSMSIDCNSRLYTRFDTEYVLVVQNDGFPLRPGLEKFVRKGYDFIGAPFVRPLFVPNLLSWFLNYCPSNGGFSLRTRKLCRLSAKLWEEGSFAKRKFDWRIMNEDLFYTETLPRSGLKYWIKRRQAPSIISAEFSYDGSIPLYVTELPFGFHFARAFVQLQRRFSNKESNMNSE